MSIAEPHDLMAVLERLERHRNNEEQGIRNRKFRRFSVRGDARLEPLQEDGPTQQIMLRDMSRGGVGFLIDQFIPPCSMWRLRFVQHGLMVGSQPVAIRYCRLIQSDLYLVGGQFIIEPFLLAAMGVSDEDIKMGEQASYDQQDISDFIAPEKLED